MNPKTINNIEETLQKIAGNDVILLKMMKSVLEIELRNIDDHEKKAAIMTILNLNRNGADGK